MFNKFKWWDYVMKVHGDFFFHRIKKIISQFKKMYLKFVKKVKKPVRPGIKRWSGIENQMDVIINPAISKAVRV
jgi:hypothetical protein